MKLFNHTIKQIFYYAKCNLDITCQSVHNVRAETLRLIPIALVTTHRKHAADVAKGISLDYDAIVIVSGDGLAHEILNGFTEHENPRAAFAIPLVPVPMGSGNGCSLSLVGLKVTPYTENLVACGRS